LVGSITPSSSTSDSDRESTLVGSITPSSSTSDSDRETTLGRAKASSNEYPIVNAPKIKILTNTGTIQMLFTPNYLLRYEIN